MLNKMDLTGSKSKKMAKDDSSSDDDQWSDVDSKKDQAMDVDEVPGVASKGIKKRKKPLGRAWHQALKKTLRRKIKTGALPDMSKLDDELQAL